MKPASRKLTIEEFQFCRRAGLQSGFDDDAPDLHQFRHLCWPYASYEGALCGSSRLWFHGVLDEESEIDCGACFEQLLSLVFADVRLIDIVGRLAEAVDTLSDIRSATEGRMDALERQPAYREAVSAGYPEETFASLRRALEADFQRHRKWASAYAARKGGK